MTKASFRIVVISSEDNNDSEDDADNREQEEDITPGERNTGRFNHRPITQSFLFTSTKERLDIK